MRKLLKTLPRVVERNIARILAELNGLMIVRSCRARHVLRSHVPSRQGLAICTFLADRPLSFLLVTRSFVWDVRRSLL